MAFKVSKPGFYARHLKALLPDHTIRMTHTLRSQRGEVLAESNTVADEGLLDRLVSAELVRPLEMTVQLSPGMTSAALADAMQTAWCASPDLEAVWGEMMKTLALDGLCEEMLSQAVVHQKLTVMAQVAPELFRRACWCAPLAAWLSERTQPAQAGWVTVAALMQDTGALHIEPDPDGVHDSDRVAVRLHPLAAAALLEQHDTLPGLVALAVAEHHEQADGSGYPRGRTSHTMSAAGSLLSVVNALWQLRFEHPVQRSLDTWLPALRIRCVGLFRRWYEPVAHLIRQATPGEASGCVAMKPDWSRLPVLQRRHALLNGAFGLTTPLAALLKQVQEPAALPGRERTRIALDQCRSAVIASGVLSDAILRWMQHVEAERLEASWPEMVEIGVVQDELFAQMLGVLHALESLVAAISDGKARRQMNAAADAMRTLLQRFDPPPQ